MDVLFCTSEAFPLIKTGGLGDVCGSLPGALHELGNDVRLVLPAYPQVIERAAKLETIASLVLSGASAPVKMLRGQFPGSEATLYLVDSAEHFRRPGNPYLQQDGSDWPDNAQRFALFARAIVALALGQADTGWIPQLVHCNDWQTGLAAPLLALEDDRPATLFTIHNLAYQGLFSRTQFQALDLPPQWWSMNGLEFHDQMSFIKGGLIFSDWTTTVSPTYAREIQTAEFGCGLEGLLKQHSARLTGILNGVDYQVWNPGRDRLIPHPYTARTLRLKQENKMALQDAFGLPVKPEVPLFGHVGRLVEQKGLDLIMELVPQLVQRRLQLVFLGTGQPQLEQDLRQAHGRHPTKFGVRIAYDEQLAHLIEAGSDAFLMPSRFEPCGLNQLYSLRYGTPPIVRRTGGLADSVVDADGPNLYARKATGFVFDDAEPAQLLRAIDRALNLYAQQRVWKDLVATAMHQDFSWTRSANAYLELYQRVLEAPRTGRDGLHRNPSPDVAEILA